MSTSETGAPPGDPGPPPQHAPSPPSPPPDEDSTLVDEAAYFVTTFVQNAASAAVEMIERTATSFDESLHTALNGNYKASCLAKDSALLLARNVKFITRLFAVGAPAEPLVPSPGSEVPPSTSSSASAPTT